MQGVVEVELLWGPLDGQRVGVPSVLNISPYVLRIPIIVDVPPNAEIVTGKEVARVRTLVYRRISQTRYRFRGYLQC